MLPSFETLYSQNEILWRFPLLHNAYIMLHICVCVIFIHLRVYGLNYLFYICVVYWWEWWKENTMTFHKGGGSSGKIHMGKNKRSFLFIFWKQKLRAQLTNDIICRKNGYTSNVYVGGWEGGGCVFLGSQISTISNRWTSVLTSAKLMHMEKNNLNCTYTMLGSELAVNDSGKSFWSHCRKFFKNVTFMYDSDRIKSINYWASWTRELKTK